MSEALLFSAESHIAAIAYDDMSVPHRIFSLIWALEAEVNNGGFRQFFHNSSGECALESPDALVQIGAHHCSELVAEAVSLIPITAEGWRDEAQRRKIVNNINDDVVARLHELDAQFYRYPDNLSALLTAFVTAHRPEFGA